MAVVFEQVLYLMLFAVIGFALCATKLVQAHTTKLLSTLGVYVFLPATIFKSFSSKCTPENFAQKYPLMLVSVGVLAVVAGVAFVMAKWFTKDEYRERLIRYSLTIANYAYIGYPLAENLFGADALFDVLIFALPMSLFTNTVAFCSLTKHRLTLRHLLNPPILAALLGIVCGLLGVELPDVFQSLINNAAACMAPICMLLTGMVISEYRLKTLLDQPASYILSLLRLIVLPSVIVLVLHLLGLKFAILPALLVYAMPCGMNTIVFPRLIGEDCMPGASLLFVSTAFSVVTIPLLLTIFKGVI